ncbi:hypothetical protein C8R45DRAFT_940051 [Mycena sanguinolenta]|nr:hypothetical protein C8R45DRAFT_940051 [Mycena sanguinolenta]
MAPKSWATEEQQTFLHKWIPDFVRRQAEKKLHLFWPLVFAAWRQEFPEETALGLPLPSDQNARELTEDESKRLGEAVKGRKSRLENWFRYQRNKISNGTGSTAKNDDMVDILLLDGNDKPKKRAHQAIKVFQQRHPELINAALTAEGYFKLGGPEDKNDWTEETDGSEAAKIKSLKSVRMWVRTRVVAGLWKDASDEEKAIVWAEIAKEKEEIRATELNEEVADKSKRTPAQYQGGIDGLETFLSKAHSAVFKGSGWVGMTLVGGPNPRMGGELSMKVICHGVTPAGNDFEDSCVDFDKHFVEPFEAFLQQVYTPEECHARALEEARPLQNNDPTRPVTVIQAPVPTPLPTVAAKKKVKKRAKKSPAESPPAESPLDTRVTADLTPSSLPALGSTEDTVTADIERGASPAISSANSSLDGSNIQNDEDAGNDVFFGSDIQNDEDAGSDVFFDSTTPSPTRGFTRQDVSRWPAGVTSPLVPSAAAGDAGPTTAVIDPQLLNLGCTPPSSAPTAIYSLPRPRPAYHGAVSEPNPVQRPPTFRLSPLFGAFHRTPAHPTPDTPKPNVFGFPFHTPQPTGVGSPPKVVPSQTAAARVLSGILAPLSIGASSVPPTSAPANPVNTAPPSISAPSTPSVGAPVVPSCVLPPAFPTLPTPPVAPVAPPCALPPVIPRLSAPPISTTPPSVPLEGSLPIFVPESRPHIRPLVDKPSPSKTAKVPPKKASRTGRGKGAKKEASAAKAAQAALMTEGEKKKRARPSKADKAATATAATAALEDVTNKPGPETPIYTMTNNNRAGARQAAQEAKEAEEKEAAIARAAQRAKGWELGREEGTVVFLRTRKPRLNPDGSLPDRVYKGVCAPPQLDPSEKALLAHVRSGGKRKAVDAPSSSQESKTKKSKK